MTDLSFTVPGEPIPKGRARTRIVQPRAGKAFASHYTPAQTKAFESYVRLLCQAAVSQARWLWSPKDRFALTVRVFRTHEGAGGDLDNYFKAVSDAINGVAFGDDRYVREMNASLAHDPASPRVEVEIRRMRIGEGVRT